MPVFVRYLPDVLSTPYPPKEVVERGYKHLTERGLQFLYIYTGSWVNQYNYLNQLYDMYPSVDFKDSVELIFKQDMNHSLTEPDSQQYMVKKITSWLKSRDWNNQPEI